MTTVAKLQLEMVVPNNSPKDLLALFDGLIPSDGIRIANVKGRKLIIQCMNSEFIEIGEIDEEGEVTFCKNNNPEIKYYPSENQKFDRQDLIHIEGKGDFNIVLMPNNTFLYNSEDSTTIEIENASDIEDVKKYLEEYYPCYVVVRKVN